MQNMPGPLCQRCPDRVGAPRRRRPAPCHTLWRRSHERQPAGPGGRATRRTEGPLTAEPTRAATTAALTAAPTPRARPTAEPTRAATTAALTAAPTPRARLTAEPTRAATTAAPTVGPERTRPARSDDRWHDEPGAHATAWALGARSAWSPSTRTRSPATTGRTRPWSPEPPTCPEGCSSSSARARSTSSSRGAACAPPSSGSRRTASTLGDREFTQGGGVGASVADQVSDDKLLGLFAERRDHRAAGAAPHLGSAHRLHPAARGGAGPPGAGQRLRHPEPEHRLQRPLRRARRLRAADGRREALAAPAARPPRTAARRAVDRPPGRGRGGRRGARRTSSSRCAPATCSTSPAGWVHSATALGGVSTHLTLGVHVWTRRHVADELVSSPSPPPAATSRCGPRSTSHRRLRPRRHRHRHRAGARRRWCAPCATSSPAAVVDALETRVRAAQRPVAHRPAGPGGGSRGASTATPACGSGRTSTPGSCRAATAPRC